MHITELDEWQGFTADMIRNWLGAQSVPLMGCPSFPVCHYLGEHTHHGHDITKVVTIPTDFEGNRQRLAMISSSLGWIATNRNISVQALLREINPRWRKGFPSNAALAEHDEWLIRVPWGAEFVAHISYGGSDDGYMILIPPDSESGECGGIAESVWGDCFYWPCDGNANRVRWPVDAEGNML